MSLGEFELIQRFFSDLGVADQVLLGPGDDAATLRVPPGHVLHISTDTSIEDIHFPSHVAPEDIAFRAVAVAVSDLAAMGATPLGMVLALSLPKAETHDLAAVASGLRAAVEAFSIPLVGGDTTRGSLAFTVTVLGSTPEHAVLLRSGAQPGDTLCISGTLGEASAGLALLQGGWSCDELPAEAAAALKRRFLRPEPRLKLGQGLLGVASSAIDVSDGLLADAGHIAAASGVALEIDTKLLPRSRYLRDSADQDKVLRWALAGGDDYELLFTLPEGADLPEGCTRIGRVHRGSGVQCDVMPSERGHDHFSG